MNRLHNNLKICSILLEYITNNPEQRFGQVLLNIGAVRMKYTPPEVDGYERPDGWFDEYNVEPDMLLGRIQKELAKRKQ